MEVKIRQRRRQVLDFTEAEVTWPSLQIDIELRSSNLALITKPGVVVDADELTLRAGDQQGPVAARAGGPGRAPGRLVAGRVDRGNLVARPPRRAFWDWLRRGPAPRATARRQGPASSFGGPPPAARSSP